MPSDGLIAVTGATGGLGGRVAARLADRGVAQRLVVRDPARAPRLRRAEVARATYQDGAAMREALAGIRTLYLVSGSEAPDRLRHHLTAVDAAVAAGVERVVYTSFVGAAPDATFTFARDHFHTEEHIRAQVGLQSTFLRNSMYLDFLPFLCGADGVIRGPAGDGRLAPIARDDSADVAAAILTGDGHEGQTYELTGPELITLAEVAEQLAAVSGRPLIYERETLEEARASRAPTGAPAWEIEGWVTSYAAIATGELAVVTDHVARIAGHEPLSLPEYLRAYPESYAHLLGG